jgi:hypothetical protein
VVPETCRQHQQEMSCTEDLSSVVREIERSHEAFF